MFENKKILAIAGVHKAATTSLYEYLMIHPDICAGKTKEIHYYTSLRFNNQPLPLDEYKEQFELCRGEKYLLDASPSYLYGKSVIANRIKEDFSDSKIIVILRDPTDRFVSFYKFLKSEFRLEKNISFSDFIDKSYSFRHGPDTSEIVNRAYKEGVYAGYIQDWLDIYRKDLKIIFFDHIKTNPKNVMLDICSWLEIDSSLYDDASIFEIKNRTRSSNSKLLFKVASFINNRFEMFFRNRPRFKDALKNIYFCINGRKGEEAISGKDKDYLTGLYHEDNRRLSKLLTDHGYKDLPGWLK